MAIEIYRPTMLPRAFEEMEDMMDRWMSARPFGLTRRRAPTNGHAWSPSIELVEKGDKYLVKAELPGVSKEDVDISMSENVLTIKGERKESQDVMDEEVEYCEITYGSFSRSLTLPTKVDADKINATYENGILEVTLPKAMAAMPKKIEVKTK
jgi:HSP20 family protein